MCEISAVSTASWAIGEELELSDTFYANSRKRSVFQVKLNSKGITLRRETSGDTKMQNVELSDIVGARCTRSIRHKGRFGKPCTCTSSPKSISRKNKIECSEDERNIDDSSAYLHIFAYLLKKKFRNSLRREKTVITLRFRTFDKFDDNIREAEKWYRLLRWLKKALVLNEHCLDLYENSRLLILLNPKSGCGKAREVFLEQVVPVMNEAEIPYDLFVTKYANYARDFVRMKNVCNWAGIVAVGGDGLFFEILNGLMRRSDWESVLEKVPIGIVPSGSGNGLARSIAHLHKEPYEPKPVLGATLTVLSGRTSPMDVVRIVLKNEVLFSFLSIGWGLISDIDIESERLRSIGYSRFTLWSLHRLVSLRTYRGKLSYLPKVDSDYNSIERKKINKLSHSMSCNTYLNRSDYVESNNAIGSSEYITHTDFEDVISLETSINHSIRSRCDSWFSAGSHKSTFYSIPESIYHSIANDSLSDAEHADAKGTEHSYALTSDKYLLSEPVPDTWVVEEGEFVMVHAAYQTHLGTDCFFSPLSKLNDGIIYLVIIRGGTSRTQLFNFLVNMSTGTHLPTKNSALIKVVPVTTFRIEPYEKEGIITVDGERVEFGPLQAEILPGIARVMVPK